MRRKVLALVALIAIWGILNTGTYIYFTNIRGFDPARVNPILAFASFALGVVSFMAIGRTRQFDRTAIRYGVGPFAIAILGIAFWSGTSFIPGAAILLFTSWICVHVLEDDDAPVNLAHIFAINTAFSAALTPIWGWRFLWHYDSMVPFDETISFYAPLGLTIVSFVVAVRIAWKAGNYSFEVPAQRGAKYQDTL